jgi:leucyl-tRNA synthetase
MVKGEGVTPSLEVSFHKTIKKVTEDIDNMKFNTAIAAMMSLLNEISDAGALTKDEAKTYVTLLCPFAPHLCEELWEYFGGEGFCSYAKWPEFDEAKTVDSTVEIGVQINGKMRGTITIPKDCDKDTAMASVMANERIAELITGKTIVKEIFVPGKIFNIVVK